MKKFQLLNHFHIIKLLSNKHAKKKNPNKQKSMVNFNNLYILKLNQHQTFKMQRVEEKEGNLGCGGYFLRTEMMGTSGPSSLSGELSHVVASPDHPNCLLLHSLIPFSDQNLALLPVRVLLPPLHSFLLHSSPFSVSYASCVSSPSCVSSLSSFSSSYYLLHLSSC